MYGLKLRASSPERRPWGMQVWKKYKGKKGVECERKKTIIQSNISSHLAMPVIHRGRKLVTRTGLLDYPLTHLEQVQPAALVIDTLSDTRE